MGAAAGSEAATPRAGTDPAIRVQQPVELRARAARRARARTRTHCGWHASTHSGEFFYVIYIFRPFV